MPKRFATPEDRPPHDPTKGTYKSAYTKGCLCIKCFEWHKVKALGTLTPISAAKYNRANDGIAGKQQPGFAHINGRTRPR